MTVSPLKLLIGLVAIAVFCSGWIVAWPWKREVEELKQQLDGAALSVDEQILIDLQDQLEALRAENAGLSEEIGRLEDALEAATSDEPAEETEPASE